MRRRNTRIVALVLSLLLVVGVAAGCGSGGDAPAAGDAGSAQTGGTPASADAHKLSFTIGDPVNSSKAMFYQDLADKTREATNGGLDITIYAGGTLFGHMECYEGVLSGAADMGWLYTQWVPDRFPLAEVVALPLQFGNQMAATYALLELYKEVPELQAELNELKILNIYSQPTNYLLTKGTKIEKPEDLQGLQIRSMAGAAADCLTAWGASPVFLSAVEIYEAMDKGVCQGAIYEWSGVKSNSLYEVIDYCTYLPLTANPFLCIMNQDSYNAIPEEYKAAFDEIWAAEQTSYDFAEMFEQEAIDSIADGVANYGIEEIAMDDAAVDLFRPAADEYIATWVANNTTDAFDAQAYFDRAVELYEAGCELYPRDVQ